MRRSEARVVFHTGYAPPPGEIVDPRRAEKVLGYLLREGWLAPHQVVVPPAPDLRDLLRVHTAEYLERVDDPREVARVCGRESVTAEESSALVTAQRWATSGTVRAAELAVASGPRRGPVVNLGGGYHHAHRDRGGGFCLFNDVAVAIAALRDGGFRGRVLVVDLDLHHGDGTRALFAGDESVLTCSVHAAPWDERPALGSIDVARGPAVGDETYLAALDRVLAPAFERGRPDLVFYVAGVDVAGDDRLGSYRLTADAILERDVRVLRRAFGLPTVMVLSGGYGPDAWRYTARTLVWALAGRVVPIRSETERQLQHFRRIARSIGTRELAGRGGPDSRKASEGPLFVVTEADLFGDLLAKRATERLLGFYTPYGLELAFERYGLLPHLRRRGYPRVRIDMNPDAPTGQSVTVSGDDARGRDDLLIELVVRESREHVPFRLLSIEWLLMQDPRAKPTASRPLLPGQTHPGLGCLPLMMGMLVMAAERLGFDGLGFVPSHYHVAAQARGLLRFLDPRDEALFTALAAVLGPLPLAEAAARLHCGEVIDGKTGEPVRWKPAPMVMPVSVPLRERVDGHDYDRAVEDAARALAFEMRAVARLGCAG